MKQYQGRAASLGHTVREEVPVGGRLSGKKGQLVEDWQGKVPVDGRLSGNKCQSAVPGQGSSVNLVNHCM